MCGTPSYLAPEMVTQSHHSLAADVFSVGSLAYFLLTGQAPFDVSSQDPVTDTLQRVSEVDYVMPEQLSAEAKALIHAALQKVGHAGWEGELMRRIISPSRWQDPLKRPTVKQLLQYAFITGTTQPTSNSLHNYSCALLACVDTPLVTSLAPVVNSCWLHLLVQRLTTPLPVGPAWPQHPLDLRAP